MRKPVVFAVAAGGLLFASLASCQRQAPPASTGGSAGVTTGGQLSTGGEASTGGQTPTGSVGAAPSGGTSAIGGGSGGGTPDEPPLLLQSAPLIFSPTGTSFGVNVAVGQGDPALLGLHYQAESETEWQDAGPPATPAMDLAEWRLGDLTPNTRYRYRVFLQSEAMGMAGALSVAPGGIVYEGSAVTQRPAGESFKFVLITDTHISPNAFPPASTSAYEYQETVLLETAPLIQSEQPDFIVNLGDMLDFHVFGFNEPPPDGKYTRLAYLNYRRCLLDALGNAAHFPVIGNWDGENGNYTPQQIAYSRAERFLYAPAPDPETYPEGGSPEEDYYAYTWGDALFVVLNVMTYTEKELLLDGLYGTPEDWTLGAEQLTWLEKTLAESTSKWKFLMIHHAVGGAGGDFANAVYGRGGGLAANIGEQARVHELMLQHGAQIFFYGHDHVFTDMVVDGIHYTLPGSAGAPWKFTTAETGYAVQWEDSGYASVRVTPDDVNVKFLALDGETLLDYTITE